MLSEPGFWVAVALPVYGLVHLVAARRRRRIRNEMLDLAERLLDDPRANGADRAWVMAELDYADGKGNGWLGLLSPLLFVGALVIGIYELFARTDDSAKNLSMKGLRQEADDMSARMVKIETGVDPREGHLWDDERRISLRQLGWSATDLTSPFASVFSYFWMFLAIGVLSIFWGFSAAIVRVKELTAHSTDMALRVATEYARMKHI